MNSINPSSICPARRTVLAAALGVPSVALLSGCLGTVREDGGPTKEQLLAPGSQTTAPTSANTSSAGAGIPAASVPVGGAVVGMLGGKPVAVAQPTAGNFIAFSATCTHKGGTLGGNKSTTLTCPVHGAQFDATSGAVKKGPATDKLPSVPVKEKDGQIVLA